NEAAARRVENAMRAVERGSKLSMQLLAFGRRHPQQPGVVNLRKMLSNMDDLLKQGVGESVEIRAVVAEDLWNTMVDPNQLESVILNLAINARDAMEDSGKLTLEMMNQVLTEKHVVARLDVPPGEYVLLAVSDTGSGMTPEVLERAFEPFFTTKPEGQGTGLGLSMAYGFVKQSGGDIRIYSEPGQGTTFRLYLPRAHGPESAMPRAPEPVPRGGSETILVVEDDIEVQSVVVGMLDELGYKVLMASDARSALGILESGAAVDLLFTDVVMPGLLRGPELAQQARLIHPDIAVLYTSGYTREAIMHDGRLEEGVGLLSKPYRRDQLATKVRYFLSGKRQETVQKTEQETGQKTGQETRQEIQQKTPQATFGSGNGTVSLAAVTSAANAVETVAVATQGQENRQNHTTSTNNSRDTQEKMTMHDGDGMKQDTTASALPAAAAGAGAGPAGSATAALTPGSLRILVVEDNEDLLMLACEMLSILGHEASGAESGERGLEVLAQAQFDVLVTDIGLPGMNGVELARQANAAYPAMKIVYASGYGDAVDMQGSVPASVLKKPYNMAQLQAILQ
ncbi:MAG: response regulator, partial [Janthinobacterium lividum]